MLFFWFIASFGCCFLLLGGQKVQGCDATETPLILESPAQ